MRYVPARSLLDAHNGMLFGKITMSDQNLLLFKDRGRKVIFDFFEFIDITNTCKIQIVCVKDIVNNTLLVISLFICIHSSILKL